MVEHLNQHIIQSIESLPEVKLSSKLSGQAVKDESMVDARNVSLISQREEVTCWWRENNMESATIFVMITNFEMQCQKFGRGGRL